MERYKQHKQTNNLLRVFLLTFFTFASLFSVTGIVYSLVTVGIGSPLFLLCSIGFAACTTLSACNAYAIRNNITHRRGSKASKKETACSTNKKLISLEDNSKNLIDLSDQPTPNEKCDTQQYTSNYIPKINEEILIPEVVENVKQNNKLSLILNDKKPLTNQNLKSPGMSQTQGSKFTGPPKEVVNQQNISNPNKSTAPIPPSMPIVIYDNSKVLSQPQVVEQNNSNKKEEAGQQLNSVASQLPPPPPMPKVNIADKSRISPQSQLYDTDDLAIPTTYPQSENNLSVIQPDRSLLFWQIREIGKNNLRKVDPVKSTGTFKTLLQLELEKRAEAFATSWSESDSLTSDPDWEEEVKVPFEAQEESCNKSTENYVEDSNHHIDSGISDDNNSPERINANIKPKISLLRSHSDNCIKRNMEQPKNYLSHLFSCSSLTDRAIIH